MASHHYRGEGFDRPNVRMANLAYTLQIEGGTVYYAKNPLPMEVGRSSWLRPVGGREINYHMLDLTCDGNVIHFAMFHGFRATIAGNADLGPSSPPQSPLRSS